VIRVLHVDDEAPIRLLSRVNLEQQGDMEVIEAPDGLAGVQLAKREQPDLILLGVMMPVLDGWQAAEELAEDQETREIPIVFLTARAELRDCARGGPEGLKGLADELRRRERAYGWCRSLPIRTGCGPWTGMRSTSTGSRRPFAPAAVVRMPSG
jgi:CheY-like chemotaxis protein